MLAKKPALIEYVYYPRLEWIVVKGVWESTLKESINKQESILQDQLKRDISVNILAVIMASFLTVVLSYVVGKEIERLLCRKNDLLETLNRSLEERVKEEIAKTKEQERLLMHKSRFSALGEMISHIAHQWRQPVAELSTILINLKMCSRFGTLDQSILEKKSNEAEKLLEYMSKTIDDFCHFFKPDKVKEPFLVTDSVDAVLSIIGTTLDQKEIVLTRGVEKEMKLYGYKNEFE